jgi:hypothetical protein
MYDAGKWADVMRKLLYCSFRCKAVISTLVGKNLPAALQHEGGSLFGRERLWITTPRTLGALDEHMGLFCERECIQGYNTAFETFVPSTDNPFCRLSRGNA